MIEDLPPYAEPIKCTKCSKPISIWESVDYPQGWIDKHPEIAGMCWQCFLEWKEQNQPKGE